jgi:ubiquinone/menaquinone biosynthesis C-methylase UbiE
MEFTGERYMPSVSGDIKYEHLHRYALCSHFIKGKSVLDIASGEGYGSALLAKIANSVIGVDISTESIHYAQEQYHNYDNLEFIMGSCDSIPLTEESVDVVVSFETIEHHDRHDEMICEIKRVLKQDGVLIISSPNRLIYSDESNHSNPYHVKELYYEQLVDLLCSHFKYVKIYGQKMASASFVFPLTTQNEVDMKSYTGDIDNLAEKVCLLENPLFYIAVCSEIETNTFQSINSLYIEPHDDLLKMTRTEFSNSQRQLHETQVELESIQSQLRFYQEKVSIMEDSKFEKLRKIWLAIKKNAGVK